MKNLAYLALLSAFLALPGCTSPGKINASAIDGLVTKICDRQDAYVNADPKLHDAAGTLTSDGEQALDSSAILRKIVKTALEAQSGTATSAANTTRTDSK